MHAGNGACGSHYRNCREDNANLKWTGQGSLDAANLLWEGSHLVSFSMFGEISM
jgi:hypothetical protein